MKKLLLLPMWVLIFGFSTLQANTNDDCKTDIYFGNGVWNKQFSDDDCNEDGAAECSQRDLDRIIQKEIIEKNQNFLPERYGTVKLQYNYGRGYMQDVLETYYQLKEKGQVNDLEFFAVMMILTQGNISLSTYATAALIESMPYTAQVEQINVNEMLTKYDKESFTLEHRVLLVSHSQGNLFANRVYDSFSTQKYKNNFANVQVASCKSSVIKVL